MYSGGGEIFGLNMTTITHEYLSHFEGVCAVFGGA